MIRFNGSLTFASGAALLALGGCSKEKEGTPGPIPTVTDTGWFETSTVATTCEGTIAQTEPAEGESGWYWRDAPKILVSVDNPSVFSATLYGPSGQVIPTTPVWVGLALELEFEGGLEADADHVLEVTDCDGTRLINFHTSEYGGDIVGGPSSLDGKTWQLDLPKATWIEPAGLGPLLTLYFTTPVLLGVIFANADNIDLVGAPGRVDTDGVLVQDLASPTWAFAVTPFDQAPYVSASSANVVFDFEGVSVPVDNFSFEATFAPDGESMGGVHLTGIADTRNLGVFVNDEENPAAICELAVTLGTICIPCSDAGPYCLVMDVQDIEADLVPGVTLREQD